MRFIVRGPIDHIPIQSGDERTATIDCKREAAAQGALVGSQEALADVAGLDRTYASGIERVVKNPTISLAERLVVVLGRRLGQLLD